MGYFPNGTSGELYEAEYCMRCVHHPSGMHEPLCAVMELHFLHNYDECNKPDSMLHKLIPRREDGFNDECRMFHEKKL